MLDVDAGQARGVGGVAQALASVYAGSRRQVLAASLGDDPEPFRTIAADLEEIAGAWASVRAG